MPAPNKYILQIILTVLSINTSTVFGQDSLKTSKTELGLAAGYVYPAVKKMNLMEYADPKRGNYFALNLNYDLYRINKRLTLSAGARVSYYSFRSTERDDHYFFTLFGTRNTRYGAVSIGLPVRINYTYPIVNNTEVQIGIGLIPCAQSPHLNEPRFPGRLYGEVFAGVNIGPVMLAVQLTRMFFVGYPYTRLLPEYFITTGALDIRYRIVRLRTKNVKLRPRTHP